MDCNFCTCEHLKCPRHLTNSDDGCTTCIQKNLLNHEIPNCFFNDAGLSKDRKDDSYQTFAELMSEVKNNER